MATQDSEPLHWHYTELDDKNFEVHGRSLVFILILFAILIVITLLCIYARWACRYGELSSTPTPPPANTTDATTATQRLRSNSVGLDRITIDRLPIILHKLTISSTCDDEAADEQCSICLTMFEDEEKVKILPNCKHCYHPECVDAWLDRDPF
ncbi:hypothetical protein MKW94_002987 [Papaver nudicaule]|uniref:RING-type domain-containing protein n=1 Tax=Papaver nudicaule TaxID=74823 RepID=A0AA41V6Y3_PAPNU|nr:hypothetical protein [Papaver nudicaule]